MEASYKQRFPEEKLNRKVSSPLEPGDHPELDTSEFLDQDDTEIYQSLIGAFQWAITIGRWDIQTAVMTMSSFRAQPRAGHLLRVKRIYNYIINIIIISSWTTFNSNVEISSKTKCWSSRSCVTHISFFSLFSSSCKC